MWGFPLYSDKNATCYLRFCAYLKTLNQQWSIDRLSKLYMKPLSCSSHNFTSFRYFLAHVSCSWRTWFSFYSSQSTQKTPTFFRHFYNPSGFVLTFPLTAFHQRYLYWHMYTFARSLNRTVQSVTPALGVAGEFLFSVGILLPLASMFTTFWQIQVFPHLPKGRISVAVLARIELAAGKTWYQRPGRTTVRLHTPLGPWRNTTLHTSIKSPTNIINLQLMEDRASCSRWFLSLRTCNPNSFIPFRASLS